VSQPPTMPAGAYGEEGQYFICGTCGKSIPISQVEGQCICGRKVCKTCGSRYPLCAQCGWVICKNCAYQSRRDQKWYHFQHKPSECLIVTACLGSPYAEEINHLRTFRDETVLKTRCGNGLMTTLEKIYYSFSPRVATYLRNHRSTRNVVKSMIVIPFLQSLFMCEDLSKSFKNKELKIILIAWMSSINLSLGIAFWKCISFLKRK
jgi:hypothetical protein